ncbi:FUSC family protein, partial [Streptomyces sp. NPDC055722]
MLVALFGSSTPPERLGRLVHRVVGTAAGAVIGVAVVHLIGPGHLYWTLTVIVVALAIGMWDIQRQYGYFMTCLVVALTQLYALSTPYGKLDWLLTQRLIDNALGMAVATACAALLLPISTRKIEREAQRGYLAALEKLIAQTAERWQDPEAPVRPRGAARAVDAALIQVQSVS